MNVQIAMTSIMPQVHKLDAESFFWLKLTRNQPFMYSQQPE